MIKIRYTSKDVLALQTAIRFINNNPTRKVNELTKSAFIKLESAIAQNNEEIEVEYTPEEAEGFLSSLSFLKNNPAKSCWNAAADLAYESLKNELDTYKQNQPKILEVEEL